MAAVRQATSQKAQDVAHRPFVSANVEVAHPPVSRIVALGLRLRMFSRMNFGSRAVAMSTLLMKQ
jgi:hypothetical protein